MPTHFITIVAHTSVFGFLYSRAIVERCLTACHCLILLVLATAIFITPETVEGCAKDPSPVFSVVSDSTHPDLINLPKPVYNLIYTYHTHTRKVISL